MEILNDISLEVSNIQIALDALDVLVSNLEEDSADSVGFQSRMNQYISVLYLIRESIKTHSETIDYYITDGVIA